MRIKISINKFPLYILLPTRLALNIIVKNGMKAKYRAGAPDNGSDKYVYSAFPDNCADKAAAGERRSKLKTQFLTPEEKKTLKKAVSELSRFHKKWTLLEVVDKKGKAAVKINIKM